MKIRIQTRMPKMLAQATVATVTLLALTFPILAFAVSPEFAEAASPPSEGFTQSTIGVGIQSTSAQAIPTIPKICCYKYFGCFPC